MTEILYFIWNTLLSTFALEPLIALISKGDYQALQTWGGMKAILLPIIPLSVVFELLVSLTHRSFQLEAYKVNMLIYLSNKIMERSFLLAAKLFFIKLLSPYQPFTVPSTWYWFIYGYIIFELFHVVSHYLAHKVRILWCLHSTHHAPRHMNLTVSYSHFFLEFPYALLIKFSICIMAGIPLPMLLAIMVIDGVWGHLIHVGEDFIKNGRMGFLEHLILTPHTTEHIMRRTPCI